MITGAVHVEGGDTHSAVQKNGAKKRAGVEQIVVTQRRTVSEDRRAGNVISTDYMRRLRHLRLVKTPYGSLVDPARLADAKALIASATQDVSAFNSQASEKARTTTLTNCLIWESLSGNRLAAVEGWVARRLQSADAETRAALSGLLLPLG